jgi:hypothetical protein
LDKSIDLARFKVIKPDFDDVGQKFGAPDLFAQALGGGGENRNADVTVVHW